jgi:cytochrome c peroxidase
MRLALVAVLLAACGAPEPPPDGVDPEIWVLCRDDLELGASGCRMLQGLRQRADLPPARGNRYGDDPRAAALGRAIFFDAGFSTVPGGVSCATCHAPEMAFTDGLATSEVIPGMPVPRNSPTLYDVARNEGFFFWDGRADSLWSQPLFAFENAIEMRFTRLEIAHRIGTTYRADYEAIFGALPPLSDAARFPPSGRPGDPAWEAMAAADRDAVNRVAANVGKALEAYMRRLVTGPSPFDLYLAGDRDALDAEQRRGLQRFVASGCASCHSGPQLTDDEFHPSTFGALPDRGRAAGIEILLASEFNSAGPYFDADAGPALPLPTGPTAADERAFRTPSMRNVVRTAPYQHDGSRTLEAILSTPGILYEEGDAVVIGAFLRALDGPPPPTEWTTPP